MTVEATGDATTATVRVHNRGDPIPPAEIAGIFEPFGRGRGGTPSAGSVGLGLFIVAAIARAHGGAISVESSEGAGTTFTLAFPRAQSMMAAMIPPYTTCVGPAMCSGAG